MTPEQENNQIDYKIEQLKKRITEDMNELLRLTKGKAAIKYKLVLVEESKK